MTTHFMEPSRLRNLFNDKFCCLLVCLLLIHYSYFLCISYDYLKITNGTNYVTGTFCGQQSGTLVTVTGSYAVLTFQTDRIVQKTGFELSFSYVGFPGKSSFLTLRLITSLVIPNKSNAILMSGDFFSLTLSRPRGSPLTSKIV